MSTALTNNQTTVRKCRHCGEVVALDDVFFPLACDSCWKPMDPVRDIEEHGEFWNTVTDPRIWEELNLGDILRPNPQQGELPGQPMASTSWTPGAAVLPQYDATLYPSFNAFIEPEKTLLSHSYAGQEPYTPDEGLIRVQDSAEHCLEEAGIPEHLLSISEKTFEELDHEDQQDIRRSPRKLPRVNYAPITKSYKRKKDVPTSATTRLEDHVSKSNGSRSRRARPSTTNARPASEHFR